MGVKDETVEAYLASVARASPTPGGGSVSALAGPLPFESHGRPAPRSLSSIIFLRKLIHAEHT